MFDRVELKQRGKAAFMTNYWKCVLAAFLISLLTAGYTGGDITYNYNQSPAGLNNGVVDLEGSSVFSFYSALTVISAVSLIIALLLNAFVFNVIEAGGAKFFVENSRGGNPGVGELFSLFNSGNYMNIVNVMFFRDLYLCLWYLCLIIPGVMKTYEYQMIPYILAFHPDASRQDVFAKSKEMMTGNKMNSFVLDLSFIGWDLLAVVTFGILEVFYVAPYKQAAHAELYNFLDIPQEKETIDPEVVDRGETWQNYL